MGRSVKIVAAILLLSPIVSLAQSDEKSISCDASDFQKVSPHTSRLIDRNSTSGITSAMKKASDKGFFEFKTIVIVWYDQDGRIFNAKLKESSGYPDLDIAIIEHMKSSHVTGKCGIGLVPLYVGNGA